MLGKQDRIPNTKTIDINADHEDLLPCDDERACTAVIVEISHQNTEDEMKQYSAVIERISSQDWQHELERLYCDLKAKDHNDGDYGEVDLDRNERIKETFQKVQEVYPHIKNTDALSKSSVISLLEHENVRCILGKSKEIHCADAKQFASMIKSYIGSTASTDGTTKAFAQWPLVKKVSLSIKAKILQKGLVLVDLPGSMDTNSARGALAESYLKNLSVTCVVAPTTRASSDRPVSCSDCNIIYKY